MLVLSFLMVSLYDMNEREVRSMALNDNIKNLPITTQANLIIFKSGSASDIVERSIWTGETYFGKYGGANKVESWVLIK